MGIVLHSLPRRSSQLGNKGAMSLIKFFENDEDVLYLYGTTGTGKSLGIEILAKEYGYQVLKVRSPFTKDFVSLLSSTHSFMTNRKMVLIDGEATTADIKALSEGVWGKCKLVIIGEDYPKNSPIRTNFSGKDYKFSAIKFHPFSKTDIAGCLSLYALELGVGISYDIINKIAEHANGDMRAARLSLKTLVASGDEDAIELFLPFSEQTYRSEIQKLFSNNRNRAKEAIETLTPYLTIMIFRDNILKFLPNDDKAMELLFRYSNLDIDATEYLVDLGLYLGKKIKTFSYLFYRKPKQFAVPNVEVDCSDGKKILYFERFERLMKNVA